MPRTNQARALFASAILLGVCLPALTADAPPELGGTTWHLTGIEKAKVPGVGGSSDPIEIDVDVNADGTFATLDDEGFGAAGTWSLVGTSGKKFLAVPDDATAIAIEESLVEWAAEYGIVATVDLLSRTIKGTLQWSGADGAYRMKVQMTYKFVAEANGKTRKGKYTAKAVGLQNAP